MKSKICSIPDCREKAYAKELCKRHYMQEFRRMKKLKSLENRPISYLAKHIQNVAEANIYQDEKAMTIKKKVQLEDSLNELDSEVLLILKKAGDKGKSIEDILNYFFGSNYTSGQISYSLQKLTLLGEINFLRDYPDVNHSTWFIKQDVHFKKESEMMLNITLNKMKSRQDFIKWASENKFLIYGKDGKIFLRRQKGCRSFEFRFSKKARMIVDKYRKILGIENERDIREINREVLNF